MTNPLPPEIEARLAEIQAAVDRYGNSCAEWQHQTDTNIKVDDEKKPERIFAECARLIKSLVEDARALGQSSAEVVGARHLAKARAEGRADVGDTASFARCLRDSVERGRVASDVEAGTRSKVRLTPTVLVNGWLLPPRRPNETR